MCNHTGNLLVLWRITSSSRSSSFLWASSRPFLQESAASVQPHSGRPCFHRKIGCNFVWIVSVKLNLKPWTIHTFVIFRKTGTFPENSHPRKLKTRAPFFRSSGPKKLLQHNTWNTLAILRMLLFLWCLRKKHWDTSCFHESSESTCDARPPPWRLSLKRSPSRLGSKDGRVFGHFHPTKAAKPDVLMHHSAKLILTCQMTQQCSTNTCPERSIWQRFKDRSPCWKLQILQATWHLRFKWYFAATLWGMSVIWSVCNESIVTLSMWECPPTNG